MIKKIFIFSCSFWLSFSLFTKQSHLEKQATRPYTVMLDPAGDAKHTGRTIDDNFERGITLQFTESLKKYLENQPEKRVILTRFPGETLEPLQNANFANRLDVDLYVSIHFYQEQSEKAQLYLYYYLSHPTDEWHKIATDLTFYPYDKAHLWNISKNKAYGNVAANILKKDIFRSYFSYQGLFGIPYKPLLGIHAPAFAIECGLKHKNNFLLLVEPFAQAIMAIIEHLKEPS